MSFAVMDLVRVARLGSSSEKLILMMMAWYADDGGGNIFPSLARLGDDCGMTARGVRKLLRNLTSQGIAVEVQRGGGGPRSTSVYAIDLDALRARSADGRRNPVPPYGPEKGEPGSSLEPKRGNPVPPYDGLRRNQSVIRRNQSVKKEEPGSPNPSMKGQDPKTPTAEGSKSAEYAFEGSAIRLTVADFEYWQSTYHGIPDIRAELIGLDRWWCGKHPVGHPKCDTWFHPISGALNRKHQEALAKVSEKSPPPPPILDL